MTIENGPPSGERRLTPRTFSELKQMIEEGVNSPVEEFTHEDFESLKKKVIQRAREKQRRDRANATQRGNANLKTKEES